MFDFKKEVELIKDEMLKDIETLVNIPSVYDENTRTENQPYGSKCRQALDKMLEIGRRDGFDVKDVDGYAGHINIGQGDQEVGILGHLDVVPVNKIGWDSDPFTMITKGSKIYGRGVADDKGPLIAGYYAAKIINKLDFEKKMAIRVIFGCDEERGSSCLRYYFKKEPNCAMGFTPDAEFPLVYGEKGMFNVVYEGQVEKDGLIAMYAGSRANIVPETCSAVVEGEISKYQASFNKFLAEKQLSGHIEEEGNHTKLVLEGKSAHASTPEFGINSIVYLAQYLTTVTDNKLVKMITKYFNNFNGNNANLDCHGDTGTLTLNVGVIEYVKEQVKLTIDIRFPAEISADKVYEKMASIGTEFNLITSETHHDPLFVDPNGELVTKLHSAYQSVTGNTDSPQIIGGGTYAKTMPNCVAFGAIMGDEEVYMHGNNEQIEITTLLRACEIYCQALYNLLKK